MHDPNYFSFLFFTHRRAEFAVKYGIVAWKYDFDRWYFLVSFSLSILFNGVDAAKGFIELIHIPDI